jgi:hypothetical protein
MAGAPKFKVYDEYGRYQAACKEPEAAVALLDFYGLGSTIRLGHAVRDIVYRAEGMIDNYDDVILAMIAVAGEHRIGRAGQ